MINQSLSVGSIVIVEYNGFMTKQYTEEVIEKEEANHVFIKGIKYDKTTGIEFNKAITYSRILPHNRIMSTLLNAIKDTNLEREQLLTSFQNKLVSSDNRKKSLENIINKFKDLHNEPTTK
jgi:hypothetical protein